MGSGIPGRFSMCIRCPTYIGKYLYVYSYTYHDGVIDSSSLQLPAEYLNCATRMMTLYGYVHTYVIGAFRHQKPQEEK